MKKRTNKIIKFNGDGTEIESDDIKEDVMNTPEKWYDQLNADATDIKPVSDAILIQLKDEAKKCLDADIAAFNIKNVNTNSDYRWMKSIMSKGTVTDKVAANTVLIQNNPVCNLVTIQNMVSMVKAGKKRECIAVMDTLTELFLSDLLRPNQKLLLFRERPLSQIDIISSGNNLTRKKYLSYWYFEDQLKETYMLYVRALNATAHDTVDSNKEKAITAMYKLLAGNPEQERNLLSYIVNKMGDPNQKIASKTIYCLTKLLHKHANMQAVVLAEIEKVLFRTNVTPKMQYYCLCFLSQFYLCHEGSGVARKLIETYFAFFKSCIKKGEVDSRMMSVLLMGVNRAYPYAEDMAKLSEHIDTLYKVVHIGNFNVSIHALNLLYQVSFSTDSISDRYYCALYKKLLDTNLTVTSQQAILLNLIFKSINKDTKIERVKCFLKRLLQICSLVEPNFACGILFMISQILRRKSEATCLIFHTSFKEETEVKLQTPEDENEVKDEHEVARDESKEMVDTSKPLIGKFKPKYSYDPLHRNPLFAGGEFCVYVELEALYNHFHPSVALFAKNILQGEIIKYSGDCLKDFSLIRFLERFVFKNPKSGEELRKQKPELPTSFSQRKHYTPQGLKSLNVQSAEYLNQDRKLIPVDELFLHTYLFNKYRQKQTTDQDDDSDVDSVASDEFEDMLNQMGGKSQEEHDEEDVDFMADVEEHKKSVQMDKKKKRAKAGSPKNDESDESMVEEEEEEDDHEEIESDPEFEEKFSDLENNDDMEQNDDYQDLLDNSDDDLSDLAFGDSDEEMELNNSKKSSKKSKKHDKKAIVNDLKKSSLFANAEEFSALLEEGNNQKIAPGSSSSILNRDNSAVKQLAWEEKRNFAASNRNSIQKKWSTKNAGFVYKKFAKRKSTPITANKWGHKNKKIMK